ncbi:MAG: glycosyltransferase [Flavobacteriaceae bacterium]|jgi:glycosyltransferase involved in cell wall biosynthesis|nr:glycosyltransferase [Flavobacteriaceae bacterium]
MKNNPAVSIVTACYNSEKYIGETIQSVLNQTCADWEWLIVDDCSTDNSVQVIKKIKDERIKLIKLTENQGAAKARNHGIKAAQGRYLTFIDSDDLWLPEFLETVVSYLKENKEEMVYTSYKRVDENLQPLLEDFTAEDNIKYNRLLYNCPMPMLTTIYDTARIGKILIPEIEKREDYALWLTILKKIPNVRAIEKPLAVYRIRSNSYSRNKFSIAKSQFSVYFKFLKLPLHKSLFFTFQWACNGLKKYERI